MLVNGKSKEHVIVLGDFNTIVGVVEERVSLASLDWIREIKEAQCWSISVR